MSLSDEIGPAPVAFPLRQWRIRNFKSIREANLDLAPLTVVAGANSSGKSSILQSILLATQACRQIRSDDAVALNGALVRLGRFEDVLSAFATDRQSIVFGADLELDRAPGLTRAGFDSLSLSWDLELDGT